MALRSWNNSEFSFYVSHVLFSLSRISLLKTNKVYWKVVNIILKAYNITSLDFLVDGIIIPWQNKRQASFFYEK